MNRCFVWKELLLHMVSVSQCHAFAKMRSGSAESYSKARKAGWGALLHRMCLLDQLRLLNLVCLTTDLKRRHYCLFTLLLSDVLLFLLKGKRKRKTKTE